MNFTKENRFKFLVRHTRLFNAAFLLLASTFLFGSDSKNFIQSEDLIFLDPNYSQIDSLNAKGLKYYRDSSAFLLGSSEFSLEESRKLDYQFGEASALLNLAIYHTLYGNKDTVSILTDQSIKIASNIDAHTIVAKNLHYKALSLQQKGNYQSALLEYTQALDLNTKLGNDIESLKQTNNLALIYRELKDYDSAKKYLDQTYDLAVKLENKDIAVISKTNQAYILLDQKKFTKALQILDSTKSSISGSSQLVKTIVSTIRSQVLTGLGRYDEAVKEAKNAILIAEELNYGEGVFNAKYSIANALFEKGVYHAAIRESEEAIKDPNSKTSTRYVHQLYHVLNRSYREIGELEKSLKYQDEYLRLNDQIFSKDQQIYAMRLKIEYDVKEQARENQYLKDQRIVDQKQIKNQQYIYLSTSLIALLGLGFAFQFYKTSRIDKEYNQRLEKAIDNRTKEIKNANKELQNSNYELERFAFIASHDLKEPLKNVISFSELIQEEVKNNNASVRLTQYAHFVEKGSKRLYDLVHSIFEFSRIEKNLLVNAKDVNLNDIISELKIDYVSKAQITTEQLPAIKGNEGLIYSVFQNLIQNGIKYNSNATPNIHIGYTEKEGQHVISVKDDGLGFDDKFKSKVFEMFTKLNNKDEYEGAGLGLAICKKIVNAHNGEIWVESKVREGSTFYLSFNV